MSKLFSIGTVAKMKGVSVKMLRHYDKLGLLKPHYVDPNTGYRYYQTYQLLLIEYITFFRRSGASLKEISDACKDDDPLTIADFSAHQINRAKHQIELLSEAITSYQILCDKIYSDVAHANNEETYWQHISERDVIIHYVGNRIATEDDVYDYYWDVYNEIRTHNLRSVYATGSIILLPEHRDTAELYYMDIFCDAALRKNSLFSKIETLPKGEYLCVNYHRNDKKTQLNILKDAIAKTGKEPRLCVEIDTYTQVTTCWDNPLYEMQVLF